jgi:hypothetical protein
MEKYLLEDFQKELSQIKEYIKHIQQVNDLVGIAIPNEPIFQAFKTHFISFRNDKKLFEYKAIIITLYGLLEKHIDLWVQVYLENISRLVVYDKLSENLRKKHFELSMKLISVVMEGRQAKYSSLKKEDILKKLNNCIENPQFYKLNVEAFTMQSGNLTHNRIEEIFNAVDVNISKELLKNQALITLTGLDIVQIHNTESSVLFGKVNELVARRNTIAHGAPINDLLDLSALEPYIDFLEKYCIAIFGVLEEKNIENHTIEQYQKVDIINIFNKKIIACSIENYEIKIGDWLIIKTAEQGNERFYKKAIQSLGTHGKNDYTELKIKEKTDIGIRIDNQADLPITIKCTFYLKK